MSEASLVAKCKKGKASAEFEVYRTYAPLLRGVCRRYIDNVDEAEDVLQEGFFRIFTQIDKFRYTGTNSFFFWMKRVMINHALNQLKKKRKYLYDESLTEKHDLIISELDDDFFDSDYSKFSKDDVAQALNRLPLPFKTVVNMAVIDGMKHKEIAEVLNIAEETSRSRLTRAKQMLKKHLSEIANHSVATNQ